MQNKFGSSPLKGSIQKIVDHLLLSFWPRGCCAIQMSTTATVPQHELFFGHDLHQLQDGGVGKRSTIANDRIVNFPHRAGLLFPKHFQNLKL